MAEHTPYVCNLDEATQKKSLEELNEDPKNRQGAIDTFRKWILEQKHFKCPTDNEFLLAFLRTRYFSQLEARNLLERFLSRRSKLSAWYADLDIGCQDMIDRIKLGFCLILPKRDKEGRRVFIIRPARFTQHKTFNKEKNVRTFSAMIEYIYMMDEMTQIHGAVTIVDLTDYKIGTENKLSTDDRKKIIQTWQNNYPARIKAFHIYNTGPLVDFIMVFVKMAMTEKIQKRLVLHGRSLESLYKHIPLDMLPDEYLEDDYEGPSAGSEQSIIDSMIKEFTKPEVRERMRYLSKKEFKIDMKEKDTDVPEASFRKLNVD